MKKQKILFWDIETSLMKTYVFDLYPERIPMEDIIQDWWIICASWMTLEDTKVKAVSTLSDRERYKKDFTDDYYVVKKLREVLEDVDLLIAHNGDKFDLKKFNARLMYHNLDPLPPIKTLDTLKEHKKIAKTTSNKLDYLGEFYKTGRKIETNKKLWRDISEGNRKAVKEMVTYNKQDVLLLRDVYLRERKYYKNHPILNNNVCRCGSSNLHKRGIAVTKVGKYQRYQCQDCGAWLRE